MDLQKIKQRFGIIGNSPLLDRAIEVAVQVAPTDLTVLITGDSGTGKEIFPQIIHQFSMRKHGSYISVNCGAIPEGTIDSELFGHVKGAFTGASDNRMGYFEETDKGTIFLDEVGELPHSTQVRLLRVLETGEFIRVGSSKTLKTNVRLVAATNVILTDAIAAGKFRNDLYYRLNTVPIQIPPLRERKEDIHLLFRKFASDFAEKYRMPSIKLTIEAQAVLVNYSWPGNIRQLKNITEQISIIEQEREISAETIKRYLPDDDAIKLPALYKTVDEKTFSSEREILYKILFDMKKDMNDLKKFVYEYLNTSEQNINVFDKNHPIFNEFSDTSEKIEEVKPKPVKKVKQEQDFEDTEEIIDETYSLENKEKEVIEKALEKFRGKRKYAAKELGISERTLYRKIRDFNIE